MSSKSFYVIIYNYNIYFYKSFKNLTLQNTHHIVLLFVCFLSIKMMLRTNMALLS